jgi:hypothetical protein
MLGEGKFIWQGAHAVNISFTGTAISYRNLISARAAFETSIHDSEHEKQHDKLHSHYPVFLFREGIYPGK